MNITKQEIETLKQVIAQANPNGWTDWPGYGKSKRTHIGYLCNRIDGGTANIPLFETNTNAKRADVLLAIYARNYLAPLIAEVEQLRAELAITQADCITVTNALNNELSECREALRSVTLEPVNQYTPWVELGLTELEYYKRRYLEMTAENARLRAEVEVAWIPVTERLPEKETSDIGEEYIVLLRYPYEISIAASFVGGDWYTGHVGCSTRWTDKVSHWRPLPAHPAARVSPEADGAG